MIDKEQLRYNVHLRSDKNPYLTLVLSDNLFNKNARVFQFNKDPDILDEFTKTAGYCYATNVSERDIKQLQSFYGVNVIHSELIR